MALRETVMYLIDKEFVLKEIKYFYLCTSFSAYGEVHAFVKTTAG